MVPSLPIPMPAKSRSMPTFPLHVSSPTAPMPLLHAVHPNFSPLNSNTLGIFGPTQAQASDTRSMVVYIKRTGNWGSPKDDMHAKRLSLWVPTRFYAMGASPVGESVLLAVLQIKS
jgi:hypothetical protein